MSTNSEGVQASIRSVTGTTYDYNGDWHALFDQAGIATGPFEGRLLAWINVQLGTTYTSLPQAQQAIAVQQGFYDWSAMNTIQLYSPEAQAAFAAMTTQPSGALKTLYNNAIVSLISAGIWAKLDALYLMNVETAQAARLNLKNPGTYNLTAVSSPTFTAKVGYTGDGSAAYLDTNFNPTTAIGPHCVQNSATVFAWGVTNVDSGAIFGQVASNNTYHFPRISGTTASRVFGLTELAVASVDSTGLWSMCRADSSNQTLYRNGSSYGANASTSSAPSNSDLSILTRGTSFSTIAAAMGGIGANLTAGENTTLYNTLNTFKTGVAAL